MGGEGSKAYQIFGSSNWAFGVPFSEMGKAREEMLSGQLNLQVWSPGEEPEQEIQIWESSAHWWFKIMA